MNAQEILEALTDPCPNVKNAYDVDHSCPLCVGGLVLNTTGRNLAVLFEKGAFEHHIEKIIKMWGGGR